MSESHSNEDVRLLLPWDGSDEKLEGTESAPVASVVGNTDQGALFIFKGWRGRRAPAVSLMVLMAILLHTGIWYMCDCTAATATKGMEENTDSTPSAASERDTKDTSTFNPLEPPILMPPQIVISPSPPEDALSPLATVQSDTGDASVSAVLIEFEDTPPSNDATDITSPNGPPEHFVTTIPSSAPAHAVSPAATSDVERHRGLHDDDPFQTPVSPSPQSDMWSGVEKLDVSNSRTPDAHGATEQGATAPLLSSNDISNVDGPEERPKSVVPTSPIVSHSADNALQTIPLNNGYESDTTLSRYNAGYHSDVQSDNDEDTDFVKGFTPTKSPKPTISSPLKGMADISGPQIAAIEPLLEAHDDVESGGNARRAMPFGFLKSTGTSRRRMWIGIMAVAVLCVVGIAVGVVLGTKGSSSNSGTKGETQSIASSGPPAGQGIFNETVPEKPANSSTTTKVPITTTAGLTTTTTRTTTTTQTTTQTTTTRTRTTTTTVYQTTTTVVPGSGVGYNGPNMPFAVMRTCVEPGQFALTFDGGEEFVFSTLQVS
ncbi:hypothetical protein HDU93_007950 [Gonapodya sp. JEL0774]|nr:hypothetical protein HDU93_007950 [Gonapodya sp. JEL0774]